MKALLSILKVWTYQLQIDIFIAWSKLIVLPLKDWSCVKGLFSQNSIKLVGIKLWKYRLSSSHLSTYKNSISDNMQAVIKKYSVLYAFNTKNYKNAVQIMYSKSNHKN